MLEILQTAWFIISHGGWVLFALLIIVMLYKLYLNEIQTQYKETLEWVFLELKPPADNPTSFYSAEQVFVQMHALYSSYSFQEKYLEGRVTWWVSLEIVSLGGKISYIIRAPKKHRQLIEASFYANFPNLVITEVEDYLKNFEYDPDDESYDLFAFECALSDDESIPIRTYKEFQSLKGPELSEVVVDPLTPLLETYTKITSRDIFALQIIIQPVKEYFERWKKHADAKVFELQGEKDFHTLDDVTKDRISAIRAKIGKQGFLTKVRSMYIAPAETFTSEFKALIFSPFKTFSSLNFNGLKPAFWPRKEYRISPTLEGPYINYFIRKRKVDNYRAFKSRSTWIGEPLYIMNTEELATLYHFPVTAPTTQIVPALETTTTKQKQPPADLPIGS